MALKYWGKTISDYSAMQWPAPDGFHVPLITEWEWIKTIMDWLGLTTPDNWRINLHMPFVGSRNNTSELYFQGSRGYYWSTSPFSTDKARCLYLDSNYALLTNNGRISAYPVRCFKDSYEIPTSSWAVVQGTLWSAWIFWNQTNGLISITSDWTTWYTIADKNLWATTVYNNWDTLTQANMWNMYQWWNNYWFPSTWSVTTSSTQVDASTYWPWNYYNSSTFITKSSSPLDWSSVQNDNLRWWVTWTKGVPVNIVDRYYWGKTISDYSAMRGPAPEWFHIPLSSEWGIVYDIWVDLWWWSSDWTNLWIALKMPFAGYRSYYNGGIAFVNGISSQGEYWYYWSSTFGTTYYGRAFRISSSVINSTSMGYRGYGYSIRCFKDTPIVPTSSWVKLYWTSIESWWIFWSSTDWLISLSNNWTTRYTIQDKNLWATTVWNSWDTLSEANCWKYYQRWNNYGFPRTWSITTSSTQVDASNYGPWNSYLSSTFITSEIWDSSNSQNLWWWVTWVQNRVAKVKEVYYNTTKIRPFYPAWIYWNQSLWLISASSNWTDWITISDKNLWASVVYNYWDAMSETNCWKFYQRWNNYWFSYTWTPSRTLNKVNVSSYWPNNYYSSSTFVRVGWDWCWRTDNSSTAALNLRWDITNTNEARKWPCPDGFHIPSRNEGAALTAIPRTLGRLSFDERYKIYKMPKCWFRDNYTSQVVDIWTDSATWTTTQEDTNFWWTVAWNWFWPARWLNIRPFRNAAIIPTDGWVKLL